VAGCRRRGETPGVEAQCRRPRWWEGLSGPQHEAKPAASLGALPAGGDRECRAREIGVKAMEAVESLEAQP
jgi:hypothetical protein